MRWVEERFDKNVFKHRLLLDDQEPLEPAMVEFWRQILTDAQNMASNVPWNQIAFQLVARESPDEPDPGSITCYFWDNNHSQCGPAIYELSSHSFTHIPSDDDSEQEADRRLLVWMLGHYQRLRDVVTTGPMAALYRQVGSKRTIRAQAAALDGWFELRVEEASPGPLPDYDQQLLQGRSANPSPPKGGVDDQQMFALFQELTSALIEYTPSHFKTIYCIIKLGMERGQHALFYRIGCPQFPDEETTGPNQRLHQAATRLARYWMTDGQQFPGIKVALQQEPDGAWKNKIMLLDEKK